MFNTIVATEKLHNCQLCSTLQIFDQEIKIISVELPEETHVISEEIILVLNDSLKRYSILCFPYYQKILQDFYLQTLKGHIKNIVKNVFAMLYLCITSKHEKNTHSRFVPPNC